MIEKEMYGQDLDLIWPIKREMFWEWLHDLQWISWGNIRPCPNCGFRKCSDCGFGHTDRFGEFDCEAPEAEDLDCGDCHYLYCSICKEKENK